MTQNGNNNIPYTQGHQNWNNRAEEMRKSAQLDQDLARMRQEEQQQEASRQRQAQKRQAEQAAKAKDKAQRADKAHQAKAQPKMQPQSTPWSSVWALIGMIVGGAFAYPRVSGMEEQWWAIGFAAVIVGVLAGRFYKVIVFCITLAVVLGVGAIAINAWAS